MPVIKHTVTIERPVSEVFSYVSDFSKYSEWQPDIISIHQTEGKTHVGSMITIERHLRAVFARLDLNADITDLQLNKIIQYKGTIGVYPVIGSYTFEPQGRTTVITETTDVRMWFLPRFFTGWLFTMALKNRSQKTLDNLKNLLESEHSHR
jgi:uncharacterized membrane protein